MQRRILVENGEPPVRKIWFEKKKNVDDDKNDTVGPLWRGIHEV